MLADKLNLVKKNIERGLRDCRAFSPRGNSYAVSKTKPVES